MFNANVKFIVTEMLNSNKICAVPLLEFVSKCNVG
jgi:hypothetical protein